MTTTSSNLSGERNGSNPSGTGAAAYTSVRCRFQHPSKTCLVLFSRPEQGPKNARGCSERRLTLADEGAVRKSPARPTASAMSESRPLALTCNRAKLHNSWHQAFPSSFRLQKSSQRLNISTLVDLRCFGGRRCSFRGAWGPKSRKPQTHLVAGHSRERKTT